jgi:peptidyl-prolyl cis-trans isomerase D
MPFSVFRRHQKKLLAILALLAMVSFVLADVTLRVFTSSYGGTAGDPVVTTIYGRKIRRSGLKEIADERNRANVFISELNPFLGRAPFGDLSTRSLVDALILEHEADRLGIPKRPEVARDLLRELSNGAMNKETFELLLRRFGTQVSGEQILNDIANQVRINKARVLLGRAIVTPLDVFKEYRAQNERVSARALAFPVEDFVSRVPDPSPDKVQAFYEKYKEVLPDPTRDTPGFKIPRQVRAEFLSIDGAALARQFREKLTEPELLSYYENRKSEFTIKDEFPPDIFADDPKAELTPPIVQPFSEVRSYLASSLADEKAQAEIGTRFGKVKDEVMIPDADAYFDALDEINEAKKEGKTPNVKIPQPRPLKDLATKEGLQYEITPLLNREQAEIYGEISGAEVGSTRQGGGRKFAVEVFDPKTSLYEPFELTDLLNRHFLARKIEDREPRVPPLDEVKSEVIAAWKREQARPLADQAAREYAEKVTKDGGKIKEDAVNGRPVIATPLRTRMQPGFPIPGQMLQSGPPTLSEIPELPNAGDAVRDAIFSLEPGRVLVAPNQPKTVYYVLTLNDRVPATFATLYAPNGEYLRYKTEAQFEAQRRREDEWMSRLRADAGLPKDWTPNEETEKNNRQ